MQQPALPEPVRGRPSDLKIEARELLCTRDLLITLPAGHTGRPAERIAADLARDTIADAPAARAYGLVDHVTVDHLLVDHVRENRDASLPPQTPR